MAARKPAAKPKVIKYTGTSNTRSIDAESWKTQGVEDQDELVWDVSNDWMVPVADVKEGVVRYCTEIDSDFAIVEIDDEHELVDVEVEVDDTGEPAT